MMCKDDLLPCPFCGGEVVLVKDHTSENTDWIRHKGGAVCGIDEFSNFSHDCDVVKLWNTRAEAQESVDVEAMVKAYEDERGKYVGGSVYYPNNQEAFKGAMRKALAIRGVRGE